ncbi:hypothetical protein D9M68_556470 [compost metagenome]
MERSGQKVGPAPDVPLTPYVNKRTGEVQQIPAGVEPSFHYPPGGRRAALAKHLVDKLETAPAEVARASIADLVGGEAFSTWYSKPAGSFPLAYLSREGAERLGGRTQLVALSEDTLAKQLREHPEITLDEYPLVQEALDRGREILDRDGSLIYVLDEEDGYVTVIRATKSGRAIFMTSFRRLSRDAARRDREIQRLLRKQRKE